MLSSGQPGFHHAPVTKVIIVSVVLCTVFGSIIGSQARLTLKMTDVLENLHFWRLISHNFVFTTPGELLFGIVLLYYFRQFERQLGSSRFATYAIITSIVYTAVLASLQLLVPWVTPASGPYSLVFASLVFFFFETPKLYRFEILGALEFSDKSFVYLIATQLMISSPLRSLISCAASIFAGILYRIPFVRENADMPEVIVSFCSQYVLPIIGTSRQTSSRGRSRRHASSVSRRMETVGLSQPPPTSTLSESNIDTLISMGFSEEQASLALQRTENDVQRATELLLNDSG